MVISIDSRDLQTDVDTADFISVTAAVNRAYCQHHGYDFQVYKMNISHLETRVKAKYKPVAPPPNAGGNTKDYASAFNVHLQQFRGATWAKIPVLWSVAEQYQSKYDYVLMVDSDAVFNPEHFNRSLDDVISQWASSESYVYRGNKNVLNASFIFLNNYPWREDMPCTGAFFFRPREAEAIFREWWDFDIPLKNFIHFHEQDALWHMIETSEEYGFLLGDRTISIVKERQFPSPWQPYRDLWVVHVASYNFMMRKPIFSTFLRQVDLHKKHSFEQAMVAIQRDHLVHIDELATAERMESISARQPELRKTRFPQHNLESQNDWYNANQSSRTTTPLPSSILYEGSVVAMNKGITIWLVSNHTKRVVPNWDTFQVKATSCNFVIGLH